MKNNRTLFVVKKFGGSGKNRRSINKRESDIKKEDINERNKEINKDLIISGNFIFNENDGFVNKDQNAHKNYEIKECEDEKDIEEKGNADSNNIINTFANNNDNKSYPHSSENLNNINKEGKNILYKYNLIIDINNLMEGFGRKNESKRENKEDHEKKSPKENGEEGDPIQDEEEKMISDFMEKKRKRLLAKVENEKAMKEKIINDFIDFEKQNLIDSYKEKKEFNVLQLKLKINSNEIDELLFNNNKKDSL